MRRSACTLDSRHAGQTDIHQQNIGQFVGDFGERFFHGTEGAHAAIAGRAVDERSQAFADFGLIFNDPYLESGSFGHMSGREEESF